MALVADTNFTNNFTTVAAFFPFPTGGSNKVLKMNNAGGGVLLDNTGSVANIGDADCIVSALIDAVAGLGFGTFGFIFNRNISGKFYYLAMRPGDGGSGNATFSIYRYSGGVGGTFTSLASSTVPGIYTVNTIFTLQGRVRSASSGPNLSILVNGLDVIGAIDINVAQSNSGQPGLAANLISGDNTSCGRYADNWFVRQV